jgi:hypothetical protein
MNVRGRATVPDLAIVAGESRSIGNCAKVLAEKERLQEIIRIDFRRKAVRRSGVDIIAVPGISGKCYLVLI